MRASQGTFEYRPTLREFTTVASLGHRSEEHLLESLGGQPLLGQVVFDPLAKRVRDNRLVTLRGKKYHGDLLREPPFVKLSHQLETRPPGHFIVQEQAVHIACHAYFQGVFDVLRGTDDKAGIAR